MIERHKERLHAVAPEMIENEKTEGEQGDIFIVVNFSLLLFSPFHIILTLLKGIIVDLRNMFILLKPLPSGLSLLVAEFEKYVKRKGHEAVSPFNYINVYLMKPI